MTGIIKKSLIGVSVLAAIAGLTLGRDTFSYVRTGYVAAKDSLKKNVPVEFEVARARDMVNNLLPEIRQHLHVIAEEEVNVEHLQKEIAQAEDHLSKQKSELLALKGSLAEQKGTYKFASRSYTPDQVRRDLSARFDRFKVAEETLASKKKILAAREQQVAAARKRLDEMLSAKRDLEVQIENLDARLKTMQAEQSAVSTLEIDNSGFLRAKQLIGDLNKQLDVHQRMLDVEGKFAGTIEVEAGDVIPEDLDHQIDAYFQSGEGCAKPAAELPVAPEATSAGA